MALIKTICSAAELPDGAIKVVDMGDCPLVVRNVRGTLHAIENVCPHRGGPVGEGDIDGDTITCPWHGWSFDINTGQGTLNPAAMIRKFPCRIEGGDVTVEI
jgi:nitrite reductase/ring-hydroxylating ferredoxin subunit